MRRLPPVLGLALLIALIFVGSWTPGAAAPLATPGAAARVALPAVDVGAAWSSQVSVQNLGTLPTFAVLELYAQPGAECQGASAPTPIAQVCLGLIAPGQARIANLAGVAAGAYSGYVVAYSECPAAGGLPAAGSLTAVVSRQLTTGGETPHVAAGAYTALAPDPGAYNPTIERYVYYAPQVRAGLSGARSMLSVQNVGQECATVLVRFTPESFGDDPGCPATAATLAVSVPPGTAVRVTPEQANLPVFFGSVALESTQPLAVTVDLTATADRQLLTYTALPYTPTTPRYILPAMINSAASAAPWLTSLKVQNPSTVNQTLVTERVYDRDGAPASSSVSQRICPASSRTILLSEIGSAPDFVGSADVDNGAAVAILASPGLDQYEGYSGIEALDAAARLGAPRLRRQAANNVVTLRSQVFVRNLNPSDSVDIALALYDEEGRLVDTEVDTAAANGLVVFDLGGLNYLGDAWRGSAIISALGAPGARLAAAVLERSSQSGADLSVAYVAAPVTALTPTATPTASATLPPTDTPPTSTPTATPTATPTPQPIVITIAASRNASGYVVSNDPQTNYFTAPDIYVGADLKAWRPIRWLGGVQFDVSGIPDSAQIVSAEVLLTGRSAVYLDSVPTMRWQVQLLDPAVDATWRASTYYSLQQAAALEPLVPPVAPSELGVGTVNVFRFTEAGLLRLKERLTSTNLVSLRVTANDPNAGYRSIFDWHSGNNATGAPVLRVTYR